MAELSAIDPRFLYEQFQINSIKDKTKNLNEPKFKEALQKEMEKKKLKEVSYQLESIFVDMMFKEMRKGLNQYRLIPENPAENIFNDMLYQEYSLELAKSNRFGLADMIYNQYSKYI